MHYIVQTDVFRESHYELMIAWLERSESSYEIVTVNPFEEDFEFKTDRKDVWCFGSTKMARIGAKYGWYPGSLYNENHDVEVYGNHYGKHMLSHDGIIMKFGDP